MFGAGEFVLERLQDKQVNKGATREGKSLQTCLFLILISLCLQSEIKIKHRNYMNRYIDRHIYVPNKKEDKDMILLRVTLLKREISSNFRSY